MHTAGFSTGVSGRTLPPKPQPTCLSDRQVCLQDKGELKSMKETAKYPRKEQETGGQTKIRWGRKEWKEGIKGGGKIDTGQADIHGN